MSNEDFVDADGKDIDPFDPLDQERVIVTVATLAKARELTVAQYLERRQLAYKRVFTSLSEDAEIVYEDLRNFTFVGRTVFHENGRIHCLLTGRQEVGHRIEDHVRLPLDAFIELYTKPTK